MLRNEFFAGLRDNLPFMPGAIAFGLLAGAVSVQSGLTEFQAILLSAALFAGNSQIVALQLLTGGAPGIIAVLACGVVNLRHVMYGMSLAPHVREVPSGWKAMMAFLMVDNVYALSSARYNSAQPPMSWPLKRAYYFGSGLISFGCWLVASVVGAVVGARIPASWQLDVIPSLGMISIIVPNIKDRPALLAAMISGVLATLLNNLPLRAGVLIAGAIAMGGGLMYEQLRSNRAERSARV